MSKIPEIEPQLEEVELEKQPTNVERLRELERKIDLMIEIIKRQNKCEPVD